MTRPSLLARFAIATLAFAAPASAATEAAFTPAAFAAAQEQGKPIVVHVTATWCPTCAKQHPIVEGLRADPAFADVQILDVDFDAQKDVVRQFGVRMQSTLIAFHGKTEAARSTGETAAPAIRALFQAAVSGKAG